MSRISRISPATEATKPAPAGAPEFQRLHELGTALAEADLPQEDAQRELLSILARLMDAEACALAFHKGGKLILRDLALDHRYAEIRAPLSSELRLVAKSAFRDRAAVAVPSEVIKGRIVLATAPALSDFAILAIVGGEGTDLLRTRTVLELGSLALQAGEQAEGNRFQIACRRVISAGGDAQTAESLKSIFSAESVLISGPDGRPSDAAPEQEIHDASPAGRLIADALAAPKSTSPQMDCPEIAQALNARSARLLGTDRTHARVLVVEPGGVFSGLQDAQWNALALLTPEPQGERSRFGAGTLGTLRKKLPAIVAASLALAVLFIPIDDKIRATAVLEPEGKRFLAAQFSSIIAETLVKPGDTVSEGDLLGRLEGEALELARSATDARAVDSARRRDVALREKRVAEAELARLDQQAALSERDLLDWRLDRLALKAPINGVVLTNSFEDAEGAPVREGDVIFEISPLDPLRVRVDVPVWALERLPDGAGGTLILDGSASQEEIALPFLAPRVRAVVSEGATVLPHDGSVPNATMALRPGQRGLVVIPSGTATIGEILFRRAWIRLSRWLR